MIQITKLFEWLSTTKIVLENFSEYLKGIMRQILDSYDIIVKLNDEPTDLAIIKKELSKIRGQLIVLKNKLKSKEYQSDDLVTLYKISLYYTETYDFNREINLLSQIYYNDPLRLKNLRLVIIESLNDKKLIEKFQDIFNRL